MTEQQLAEMRQALKRAFQLGQNYWSWADSEYSSHWKKADAAKAEFDKLVEDTIRTAIEAETAHGQEPVAWMHPNWPNYTGHTSPVTTYKVNGWKPLYTAPPAQEFVCSTGLCNYRKPLTDEQIGKMYNTHLRDGGQIQRFARAIEAAHGIGAKK
mgnify:CR=1 FL=1